MLASVVMTAPFGRFLPYRDVTWEGLYVMGSRMGLRYWSLVFGSRVQRFFHR